MEFHEKSVHINQSRPIPVPQSPAQRRAGALPIGFLLSLQHDPLLQHQVPGDLPHKGVESRGLHRVAADA